MGRILQQHCNCNGLVLCCCCCCCSFTLDVMKSGHCMSSFLNCFPTQEFCRNFLIWSRFVVEFSFRNVKTWDTNSDNMFFSSCDRRGWPFLVRCIRRCWRLDCLTRRVVRFLPYVLEVLSPLLPLLKTTRHNTCSRHLKVELCKIDVHITHWLLLYPSYRR